jgi:hypothetical protein
MLPVGTVSTFTSTRLTGYLQHSGTAGQENEGKQGIHVQERIDGPMQVGTNDGEITFGFVLPRQILTQPRGSEK